MSVVAVVQGAGFAQIHVIRGTFARILMQPTTAVATFLAVTALLPSPVELHAQDIPGIEICTVEKTMERRTSCLQSNIDFLQKTITKLTIDHQQKLDAVNRQIEALKAAVAGLQKVVVDLQAAHKQLADDMKAQPAKGATAPASEAAA